MIAVILPLSSFAQGVDFKSLTMKEWPRDRQMGPQQLLSCHQNAAVELQKPGRCHAHF